MNDTTWRNPYTPQQNPVTKFTVEQMQQYQNQYQQPQQQALSDPYNDFKNLLNSCSDIVREKILNDNRFQQEYATCEEVLKQVLYAKVIPEVLSDQNGRIMFEKLFATAKNVKEELVQKDIQKEKQLELLMNDEVVLRRLQEIQNGNQQTNDNSQNNQQSQNKNNYQKNNNQNNKSVQQNTQGGVTE